MNRSVRIILPRHNKCVCFLYYYSVLFKSFKELNTQHASHKRQPRAPKRKPQVISLRYYPKASAKVTNLKQTTKRFEKKVSTKIKKHTHRWFKSIEKHNITEYTPYYIIHAHEKKTKKKKITERWRENISNSERYYFFAKSNPLLVIRAYSADK